MGRLIFLGTGDPLNYERAQTALAIPLPDGETALLDSSSGPILLRQLHDAGIAPVSVRHLFVSHRHFDHAGGLAPLLVALVPLRTADITVYASSETLRALHKLLTLTIPGVEDWLGARLHWRELTAGDAVEVGGLSVTPFAVEHGLECVGFRLTADGRAVVFTADTKPCASVVRYATGADLLIHDVYGAAGEAESAHLFGHSTATDAGEAARAAGTPRLVLTHFRASAYSDPARLRDEAAAKADRQVELARDLATIEF